MSKSVEFFVVDSKYLAQHPNEILVCDGNFSYAYPRSLGRFVEKQIYSFITHILPRTSINRQGQFFTPEAYLNIIYPIEEALLIKTIKNNPNKTFLVNPLGYFVDRRPWDIYSTIISYKLRRKLNRFDNVVFLWKNLLKERREECPENKNLGTKQEHL